MPITDAQKEAAEAQQWEAARDATQQVRLVAGPGTGKTHAIQKKVLQVLIDGAVPENVYVISFTRATCAELQNRILKFCTKAGYGDAAQRVRVSTMHSLGLYLLRRGNQLSHFPCEPTVMDDWEQNQIYDREFSSSLMGCTPGRAKRIRQAHDAAWDTLDPKDLDEAAITDAERTFFDTFHSGRTRLYSCLLPGEIIYKCVEALEYGALDEAQLPTIDNLIVDEYQDLNVCDQKFVRLLCERGAKLFVAGDDDQSIYASLRHSNPAGTVHFDKFYPDFSPHELTDCFRCAPAIVDPALRLISKNPDRLEKNLIPLYGSAEPPVPGRLLVWSFLNQDEESRAIALSCKKLIEKGMEGQEGEIVILICNRKVQLDSLTRELSNLGLPYDAPLSKSSEDDAIRAVYCLLRIIKSVQEDSQSKPEREKKLDYPAYRSMLCLISGIGPNTAREIANLCLSHNCNFLSLFHRETNPHWLSGRAGTAIDKVRRIVKITSEWDLSDPINSRIDDIAAVIENEIFSNQGNVEQNVAIWKELATSFAPELQLSQLLDYLAADTESDKAAVLKLAYEILGIEHSGDNTDKDRKIRILTMHGAKGLSGKVVFIPSANAKIIPSSRAYIAPGLLVEQRRLFYVSLTRAKAACIISHATLYTGAAARTLEQTASVRLTRSEFLNDMEVRSVNNSSGLSEEEISEIMENVNNLE